MHGDKTKMLKKFPSNKINGIKNALFLLSRATTHHSFTFNLRFLYNVKHKVRLSKTVCGIFHFRFHFQTAAFTMRTYSFLDHHLQQLAQRVKSYIKGTDHFLNKIKKTEKLPERSVLCTMDLVGLYPNIPHREGLASLDKFLETTENKQISSDTLAELAEIVLKNNIFEFDEKTFKQKRGTVIGTKFAPPYAILFMADRKEKLLEIFGKK